MNRIFLKGNLGKDPEINTTKGDQKYARFSVATSESYKDKGGEWQQQTEWHNCIAWRNQAEKAERLLAKGTRVFVEGKVTYRKKDEKIYTTVVVDRFEVLTNGKKQEVEVSANSDDDMPF